MDQKKLNKILADHAAWVGGHDTGARANLQEANLQGADLLEANLLEANLLSANLLSANLRVANLRLANLQEANLQGADLRGANLDFSSGIPFCCGSIGIIADDRLVAQMLFHLTRLDTSKTSGGVKEAMEHIRAMAISDLFCEFRDDIEKLEVEE